MKKIYPSDEKFWHILLWLHIHNLIDEYIEMEVQECERENIPVRAGYITEMLRQVFRKKKLWFTGGELLQVWLYGREHPEIRENCEKYMRSQNIETVFP